MEEAKMKIKLLLLLLTAFALGGCSTFRQLSDNEVEAEGEATKQVTEIVKPFTAAFSGPTSCNSLGAAEERKECRELARWGIFGATVSLMTAFHEGALTPGRTTQVIYNAKASMQHDLMAFGRDTAFARAAFGIVNSGAKNGGERTTTTTSTKTTSTENNLKADNGSTIDSTLTQDTRDNVAGRQANENGVIQEGKTNGSGITTSGAPVSLDDDTTTNNSPIGLTN